MDVLIVINTALSVFLLCDSFMAITNMNRRTSHWIRSAYVLLGTGAFSTLLAPLFDIDIPIIGTILLCGIVIFMNTDKRGTHAFYRKTVI